MRLSLGARVDRVLRPIHRWIWSDANRRVRKLLAFAKVEGDGGRDIIRAAEVTPDPLLRRLYLAHAMDELHHSDLFRDRGAAITKEIRMMELVHRVREIETPEQRIGRDLGGADDVAAAVAFHLRECEELADAAIRVAPDPAVDWPKDAIDAGAQ